MHQVKIRGRNRHKVRVGKDFSGTGGSGGTAAGQSTAGYVDFYHSAVVDIDDKVADRYLNQKNGSFWTVPYYEYDLIFQGSVTAGSVTTGVVAYAFKDLVIHEVSGFVGAAPTGTAMAFDVKIAASPTAAGTSIFAAGSAPTIGTAKDNVYVTGTNSIPLTGVAVNWPKGTFARVEVTQNGGTGTAALTGYASNLVVNIGAALPELQSTHTWEVGDGATSANAFHTV